MPFVAGAGRRLGNTIFVADTVHRGALCGIGDKLVILYEASSLETLPYRSCRGRAEIGC